MQDGAQCQYYRLDHVEKQCSIQQKYPHSGTSHCTQHVLDLFLRDSLQLCSHDTKSVQAECDQYWRYQAQDGVELQGRSGELEC